MRPLLSPFRRAAADAVATALGFDVSGLPVSTPPDPMLGDYAVGCFAAARALRADPSELARKVVVSFRATELLASAQATGPYVNFKLQRPALIDALLSSTLPAGADPI